MRNDSEEVIPHVENKVNEEINEDSLSLFMHLQKMRLNKKKSSFEELAKNRKKLKELWKALK